MANHLQLLEVREFDNKIRCGRAYDGGYVIGQLAGEYDCYISAGIGDDESFTRDFFNAHPYLNKANCYAFDGTIADYPYHYTTEITFIKKNIGCINNEHDTNLHDLIERYDNIFLKIDIEGGEYPWLFSLNETQLRKFKQIVIEFHGITNDGWGCSYGDKVKCLEKLSSTHYIIHAHGNNYAPIVNGIPDVIELTYVNKKYFVPKLNKTALPIHGLDFPNNNTVNDIGLNFYPFVST